MSDRGGADPDRALVVKLMLADTPRFDLASRMPAIREVLRTVRALPGVEHAAIGTNIPPRVSQISFSVEVTSNGHSEDHRRVPRVGDQRLLRGAGNQSARGTCDRRGG